jgi:hypothetical protein
MLELNDVLEHITETSLIQFALNNIKNKTASVNLIDAASENALEILRMIKFLELGVYGECGERYSYTTIVDNVRCLINEFLYLKEATASERHMILCNHNSPLA